MYCTATPPMTYRAAASSISYDIVVPPTLTSLLAEKRSLIEASRP